MNNLKPNPIIYYAIKLYAYFFNKLKINNHFIRNELKGVKEPAIILCNHVSSYDQMIVPLVTKRRINFVVADSIYYSKLHKTLKALGTINKKQFFTTIKEYREIKSVLNNGGIVGIFPAGLCTSDGVSTTIPKATGKFIKSLGVSVYICKTYGMYLSNKKWTKKIQKGYVETEVYKLYDKNELNKFDEKEVYEKINDALSYDEYSWQKTRMIKFKDGNVCYNYENILYSCPKCKSHFSIINNNNQLECNACKAVFKFNDYSFIESNDLLLVNNPAIWHRKLIDDLKNKDINYQFEAFIKKQNNVLCDMIDVGSGIVSINKDYVKIEIDSKIIFEERADHFFSLPMIPGEYFDLQSENDIYRCYPKNPKDVSYITDIVISLYENYNN